MTNFNKVQSTSNFDIEKYRHQQSSTTSDQCKELSRKLKFETLVVDPLDQCPNIENRVMRENYMNWMLGLGPFDYFFTITFSNRINDRFAYELINRLLKFINRKLFGRKMVNRTDYVDGFVAEEKHLRRDNQPLHFHFLIKKNPKYHRIDAPSLEGLIIDGMRKINQEETKEKGEKLGSVFDSTGLRFTNVYYEIGAIAYMTKVFCSEKKISRPFIQPLCNAGLSQSIPLSMPWE